MNGAHGSTSRDAWGAICASLATPPRSASIAGMRRAVLALCLVGCTDPGTPHGDASALDVSPRDASALDVDLRDASAHDVDPRDASALDVDAPEVAPEGDASVCTFYDVPLPDPAYGALRCESADEFGPPGSTVAFMHATDRAPACDGRGAPTGPVRWFRATVPAGHELWAQLLTGPDNAPPAVRAYPACGDDRCLAAEAGSPSSRDALVRWRNEGSTPREVRVAAGSAGPAPCGPAMFNREVRAPAANNTCATATPPGADTFDDLQPELGVEAPSACGAEPSPPRPALWYRVRVPARTVLRALAFDTISYTRAGVDLRLMRTCGGACELAGTRSGLTSRVVWSNEGADAEVLLALSTTAPTWFTRTRLTLSYAPLPPNARCAGAVALDDGASLAGDVSVSNAPPPACVGRPGDRALFYRVTVPAGRTLVVTARGTSSAEPPALAVLSACDATACLATSTSAGAMGVARYENTSTVSREVIVAASAPPEPARAGFVIAATTREPAANGRCATPQRVSDGDVVTDARTLDGRDPVRACVGSDASSDALWYAVRLGAGEQLVAEATSTAPERPRLRLVDGCAATGCLAGETAASRVAWTNAGDSARELLLAVSDPRGATADARATLRVTARRVPYRVTSIAAACDDMTGATRVPWETTVLGTSTFRAYELPFAFEWFGAAVRYWVASPNGFVHLTTEPGYSPTGAGVGPFPTEIPGALLAPFSAGFTSDATMRVSTRTVDGPRRHVTVQWSGVRLVGEPETPLTFQVWIVDGGAVEFHYCAMGASAQATGAAASIGVQGGVGPLGVSYAYLRAGAATTGTGLRVAP